MSQDRREIEVLREVVIKVTKLLAGQSIEVTQRGAQAYVRSDRTGKPVCVNIPYIPDNATQGFMIAVQGFIDHEVGHVLFTDWDVHKKIRNVQLHGVWNVIEDPFIERMMGQRFPGAAYNLDQMGGHFIEHITKPALARCTNPQDRLGVLLVPVFRGLSGQAVFDRWCKAEGIYAEPLIKAVIDGMSPATLKKLPHIKTTKESLAVARELFAVLNPPEPPVKEPAPPPPPKAAAPKAGSKPSKPLPPAPPADPDEEEVASEEEATHSRPGAPSTPAPEEEAPEEEAAASGAGEEEGAEEEPAGPAEDEEGAEEEPAGPAEDEEEEAPAPAPAPAEEPELEDEAVLEHEDEEPFGDPDEEVDGEQSEETGAGGGKGGSDSDGAEALVTNRKVPVSDFMKSLADSLTAESTSAAAAAPYLVFSHDKDRIEPYTFDASEWKDKMLTDLDEAVLRMIGVMAKDIERMMASKSRVQNVPGYRSGRLHAGNLHRLFVGDDRVFRRRHESHGKETVVSLLVDNSGSMTGTKMATAMRASYALSLTLERVGIRHEVIGFTTESERDASFTKAFREEERRIGRPFTRSEAVYMPVYKGYGERLTPAVKKRLAHAAATQDFLRNNIDGEAIEVATRRLLAESAERHILIVLSDGSPSCATPDHRALYAHCKEAVRKAEAAGAEVIGIGIEDDSVEHFYPKRVVINDVGELPGAVMGHLKAVLAA